MRDEVLLTAKETASFIGCSPATVKRMLRDRELPGCKIGSSWRVPRAALVDALMVMAEKHWQLPAGVAVEIVEKPVLVVQRRRATRSSEVDDRNAPPRLPE